MQLSSDIRLFLQDKRGKKGLVDDLLKEVLSTLQAAKDTFDDELLGKLSLKSFASLYLFLSDLEEFGLRLVKKLPPSIEYREHLCGTLRDTRNIIIKLVSREPKLDNE